MQSILNLTCFLLTTSCVLTIKASIRVLNVTKGCCPDEEWMSVARMSCVIHDHFHCLKNEHGGIVLVCSGPIWVGKGKEIVQSVIFQIRKVPLFPLFVFFKVVLRC